MRPKEDQSESAVSPIPGSTGFGSDSLFDARHSLAHPDKHRIAQLEQENTRLQKLVAELLVKNQQLRKPD
jgi:hypothetical protein